MKISVIIPTYYRYPSLETVLRLLSQQTRLADEVVVVDQTPLADRPVKFYARFPSLPLIVLDMAEPSLSGSRNQAARASHGDVLILIDDDMEFGPRLLEQHLQVMTDERVDVVFGAISTSETLQEKSPRDNDKLDPVSIFLKSPNCRWNGMILITSGANVAIKKNLFFAVGGYDENMPRMEDIELGYRLFRHGAKMLYSEKPLSRHMRAEMGGTRKTQPNLKEVRLLSKVYLHKKHFPGWTTRQYILKEVLNAVTFCDLQTGIFRWANVVCFYSPIQSLWRLWRANTEASKRLANTEGIR